MHEEKKFFWDLGVNGKRRQKLIIIALPLLLNENAALYYYC